MGLVSFISVCLAVQIVAGRFGGLRARLLTVNWTHSGQGQHSVLPGGSPMAEQPSQCRPVGCEHLGLECKLVVHKPSILPAMIGGLAKPRTLQTL